jgi:hypothetical protein
VKSDGELKWSQGKARTMNEMNAVGFAFLTVPLLSFASAGMFEFQRDRASLRSLTRMVPLAIAVVISVLLLVDVYYPYFSVRARLSRPMSSISLLVGASALICPYKSRLTKVLIFIGGLLLAFFWLLDRWVA